MIEKRSTDTGDNRNLYYGISMSFIVNLISPVEFDENIKRPILAITRNGGLQDQQIFRSQGRF